MTCVGGSGTGRHACKAAVPHPFGVWQDSYRKLFEDAGWFLWPDDCAVKYDGTALCPKHRDPKLEAAILASVPRDATGETQGDATKEGPR